MLSWQPQVTEGFFRKTSHIKQKIPQEPLHRLTAVPLVLSGPLCPAGISPPRGESPLSGEAIMKIDFRALCSISLAIVK